MAQTAKETERKAREISQQAGNPRTGEEMATFQRGQAELQNIHSQQQNLLREQAMRQQMRARENQTLAQAGELGVMSAVSQSASQQLAGQVSQMNPQTQAVMAKYGVRQAKPSIQVQRSKTQAVTPQKIQITNNNITTTKNDIKITQPGAPAPRVVSSAGGGAGAAATVGKFKTWLSNVFARQREEDQVRSKEYQRKEWSLSHSASRMMRGLEKLGKTFADRLDPRKLTKSGGMTTIKLLSFLGLITTLSRNWPKILDWVKKGEVWLEKIAKFFGIGVGWDNSGLRQGLMTFLGQKDAGPNMSLGDALYRYFWDDGKDGNGKKGILNVFWDRFKDFWAERAEAISKIEFPSFDNKGDGSAGWMSGLLGGIAPLFSNLGRYLGDVFQALFSGKSVLGAIANRNAVNNTLDRWTSGLGDENGTAQVSRNQNASNYNEIIEINNPAGGGKIKVHKGDQAAFQKENYQDFLTQSDLNNDGTLSNAYGATARVSNIVRGVVKNRDTNSIRDMVFGLSSLQAMATAQKGKAETEGTADRGVVVNPGLIKDIEAEYGIKIPRRIGEYKYVLMDRAEKEKYTAESTRGLLDHLQTGLAVSAVTGTAGLAAGPLSLLTGALGFVAGWRGSYLKGKEDAERQKEDNNLQDVVLVPADYPIDDSKVISSGVKFNYLTADDFAQMQRDLAAKVGYSQEEGSEYDGIFNWQDSAFLAKLSEDYTKKNHAEQIENAGNQFDSLIQEAMSADQQKRTKSLSHGGSGEIEPTRVTGEFKKFNDVATRKGLHEELTRGEANVRIGDKLKVYTKLTQEEREKFLDKQLDVIRSEWEKDNSLTELNKLEDVAGFYGKGKPASYKVHTTSETITDTAEGFKRRKQQEKDKIANREIGQDFKAANEVAAEQGYGSSAIQSDIEEARTQYSFDTDERTISGDNLHSLREDILKKDAISDDLRSYYDFNRHAYLEYKNSDLENIRNFYSSPVMATQLRLGMGNYLPKDYFTKLQSFSDPRERELYKQQAEAKAKEDFFKAKAIEAATNKRKEAEEHVNRVYNWALKNPAADSYKDDVLGEVSLASVTDDTRTEAEKSGVITADQRDSQSGGDNNLLDDLANNTHAGDGMKAMGSAISNAASEVKTWIGQKVTGIDSVKGEVGKAEDLQKEITIPEKWSEEQKRHAKLAWDMAKYFHSNNPKVDPRIVYGQMVVETGEFTSPATKGYNYGGYKVSGTKKTQNNEHGHSLWDTPEQAKKDIYKTFYAPGTRQSYGYQRMGSNVDLIGDTLGVNGTYYFGGNPKDYQKNVISKMKQAGFMDSNGKLSQVIAEDTSVSDKIQEYSNGTKKALAAEGKDENGNKVEYETKQVNFNTSQSAGSDGNTFYKPTIDGSISSDFGVERTNDKGNKYNHTGVDISATKGSPVFSVRGGTVTRADRNVSGYGNLVVVQQEDGKSSYYAHLDQMMVSKGDSIQPGQQIGTVGNTGRSRGKNGGYHLHYEVRNEKNDSIDPSQYLSKDFSTKGNYGSLQSNVELKDVQSIKQDGGFLGGIFGENSLLGGLWDSLSGAVSGIFDSIMESFDKLADLSNIEEEPWEKILNPETTLERLSQLRGGSPFTEEEIHSPQFPGLLSSIDPEYEYSRVWSSQTPGGYFLERRKKNPKEQGDFKEGEGSVDDILKAFSSEDESLGPFRRPISDEGNTIIQEYLKEKSWEPISTSKTLDADFLSEWYKNQPEEVRKIFSDTIRDESGGFSSNPIASRINALNSADNTYEYRSIERDGDIVIERRKKDEKYNFTDLTEDDLEALKDMLSDEDKNFINTYNSFKPSSLSPESLDVTRKMYEELEPWENLGDEGDILKKIYNSEDRKRAGEILGSNGNNVPDMMMQLNPEYEYLEEFIPEGNGMKILKRRKRFEFRDIKPEALEKFEETEDEEESVSEIKPDIDSSLGKTISSIESPKYRWVPFSPGMMKDLKESFPETSNLNGEELISYLNGKDSNREYKLDADSGVISYRYRKPSNSVDFSENSESLMDMFEADRKSAEENPEEIGSLDNLTSQFNSPEDIVNPENVQPVNSMDDWRTLTNDAVSNTIAALEKSSMGDQFFKEYYEKRNFPELANILSKYDPMFDYKMEILRNDNGKKTYIFKRRPKQKLPEVSPSQLSVGITPEFLQSRWEQNLGIKPEVTKLTTDSLLNPTMSDIERSSDIMKLDNAGKENINDVVIAIGNSIVDAVNTGTEATLVTGKDKGITINNSPTYNSTDRSEDWTSLYGNV